VYNFEVANTHTYFVGTELGGVWVHNACPDPYAGDPFPGMGNRQGIHSPVKAPGTPYHNFPPQDTSLTPLNPAELPPGISLEGVLEDGWNNPMPGGSINPITGGFIGEPGYPVNAAGWTRLDIRVSNKGVHGWPIP
jgi:hypothetical protein